MAINPQDITTVSCAAGKLHVQVGGSINVANVLPLLERIRQLAVAGQANRVLIDATAFAQEVTVTQRMNVALAIVDKLRGYQVAGVFSQATFDPQRLAENIAVNRGANLKVFTSLPEAAAWLEK